MLLEADPLVSHDRPALHALGSPGDRDVSAAVARRVPVPRAEAERRPGPLLHRQFPRHRGVDLWRHARSRPRTLAPNRGRPPKRDPHRATSTARVPPRRSCLRPRYRRRAGLLQPNSLRRPPRAHDSDPARHRPGTETVTFAHENFPHTRGCRCLSDRGWYERMFHGSSHGFRTGRSCHTAIAEAKGYVEAERYWMVDIDLEKFFDRVPHQRLLAKLRRTIRDERIVHIIGTMLRAGVVMSDGVVIATEEGTPQGGPLSP